MPYDLILRGATVIDPSQDIHRICDVAIHGHTIAGIADRIDDADAEIIELTGKFVTPGWIDLHAHIYAGATTFGIKADALCLATGVTTIVDAGSSGMR